MAHEERACFCCEFGTILVCERPLDKPVKRTCEKCGGSGVVRVFRYEKAAPDLRGRDEAEVLWLSWWGTPRERKAAHKELCRRDGGAY